MEIENEVTIATCIGPNGKQILQTFNENQRKDLNLKLRGLHYHSDASLEINGNHFLVFVLFCTFHSGQHKLSYKHPAYSHY